MNTEVIEETRPEIVGMPATRQTFASESSLEVADFRGDEKAGAWVSRERICEWVTALEALLTPEERRDFTQHVAWNHPYSEAARPRWGTMLNLYLWALRFDGWSAEEDRELPAGEYVEAFVKATGIPGPQPTDETLQAWTYQLGYVAAEVRNLAEFVTAMTRYRATGSTVGHAFLPSQVAKLERYTGVKADYGD